jgi:hypothetical protein
MPGGSGREVIVAAVVGEVLSDQIRRFGRLPELPAAAEQAASLGTLRERLGRLGLQHDELDAAAGQAARHLAGCLTHERFRAVFHPRNQQAEGPLRLSGLFEGRLVAVTIDRSFVDPSGERWIVDFPADGPAGAHDAQYVDQEIERHRLMLPERRHLVTALYGQPARAGLFFPLAARWVEL